MNKINTVTINEEQEKMNKLFALASPIERSKLTYVQIDLGELGIVRAELTKEERTQFARDIISGLSTKGAKLRNSKGGSIARNALARSFYFLKESIENGKNGAEKRWGNNGKEDK